MNTKTKILNKENNRLDAQIREENQAAFTDIICYLRSSNLSDYDIEVVRHDLTEIILSAQERGENIDTVIGGDYQAFCDEVIASLPPKTVMQQLLDVLDSLCLSLSILFALNILISKDTLTIIENLFKGNPVNLYISVSAATIASITLIILFAHAIVYAITKNAFHKESKHKKIIWIISCACIAILLLGIAWIGRSILFSVHLFVACIVTIILYVVHKLLSAYC